MIYLDGRWVEDRGATISVMDLAVLRGFGIFDFLRTYGVRPFRLEDHIERFFNSARHMGMKPVYSEEEMVAITKEGIERCGFENTNIKMIQTGGISADGFTPAAKQTFFMYFYEAHEYPAEMYEKGVALKTSRLMRQVPLAKTINYGASITEVMKAQQTGFVDILHTDHGGNIYEGTRSNFFAVKKRTLITAEKGILEGITRKVILEIAKEESIPVEYRFVTKDELSKIDEAFTTNSSQEIVPVVKINDMRIGDGNVGDVTMKLMKKFKEKVKK